MFFRFLLTPFLSKENKPIWFIIVDGKKEGPYSLKKLKNHPKITPLSLVWKKGFSKWVPMGSLKEFQGLFQRKDRPSFASPINKGHELVLEERIEGFSPSIWWILLAVLVLFYAFIKLWFYR